MVNFPAKVDLVVPGSGARSMTAALTGVIPGMDVLLVEGSNQVGLASLWW